MIPPEIAAMSDKKLCEHEQLLNARFNTVNMRLFGNSMTPNEPCAYLLASPLQFDMMENNPKYTCQKELLFGRFGNMSVPNTPWKAPPQKLPSSGAFLVNTKISHQIQYYGQDNRTCYCTL